MSPTVIMPRWIALLLAVVVGSAGVGSMLAHAAADDADVIQLDPFPPGGEFVLMHAHGPVALADLRGKVVLLFFGYTHCPDICPTTITVLQKAVRMLPEPDRSAVRVVFVSVDPERDSPKHVSAYARHFGEQFLGVTGEPQVLADIADRYGAQFRRTDPVAAGSGHGIEHSAGIHVIDTRGRLRAVFRHSIAPQKLAGGIHHLLNETSIAGVPPRVP